MNQFKGKFLAQSLAQSRCPVNVIKYLLNNQFTLGTREIKIVKCTYYRRDSELTNECIKK